ncbi:MAG: hypothetical protein JWO69_273 [Thermoleophilia bacterium]|jgi:hypothetical protein|nr:hypothetical protein [Thermoleophilia bacterium]
MLRGVDETTHIEIDGRRWRRSDPAIPEPLRVELVRELMAARRAVAAGKRHEDEGAITAARARVQDAKVALGERGPEWWEERSEADHRVRIEAAVRALLRARVETSTICPSDAARIAASPDWRPKMQLARDVAATLHDAGVIEVRQKGERVPHPRATTGPLRLARGSL